MPYPNEPVLSLYIDWNNDGVFDPVADLVKPASHTGVTWDRGRSADFGTDMTGQATFVLNNLSGVYNPATNANFQPGRRVLITSLFDMTRAHYFGRIQRITPDAWNYNVTVTVYDQMQLYVDTDVVVPSNPFIQRTARDVRIAVLEDFERGDRNMLPNPEFAVNISYWQTQNVSIPVRITGDGPLGLNTCAEITAPGVNFRCGTSPVVLPTTFAGVDYSFSLYAKSATAVPWSLNFGTTFGSSLYTVSFTPTTSWARYSASFALPTTQGASAGLQVWAEASAASVLRIGASAFTRGPWLLPYSASGTAGRWPNFVGNGSFDSGALNGWYDSFTNLCTNGSFETNTTGWSGGAGISRVTTDHVYGTACLQVTAAIQTNFPLTGTFKAGVAYQYSAWGKGGNAVSVGVQSIGTPADDSHASFSSAVSWTLVTGTWTPSTDRTDAQIYGVAAAATVLFDGFFIARADSSFTGISYPYSDSGPAGGGSFVTTRGTSSIARWGSQSQSIVTPATAGAGRVYDFAHYGSYFLSGQPYTLSCWINPSSTMPYKVALSANKGDGTFDEASTTGSATANVPNQITVTWTPSADRSSAVALSNFVSILQTDATAREFTIDGVRVIPGSVADSFEQPYWLLSTTETDTFDASAAFSGTAESILASINNITLARHYIKPTLTAPYYQYVTTSRVDLPAKASAETFVDNFHGFTAADLDRTTVVNRVEVVCDSGTNYYSNEASVNIFGPVLKTGLGSSFISSATADSIGAAIMARYFAPRARPNMQRINHFDGSPPSQLTRELDDLVTVDLTRLGIASQSELIVRVTTKVTDGPLWDTTYGLEESPFGGGGGGGGGPAAPTDLSGVPGDTIVDLNW